MSLLKKLPTLFLIAFFSFFSFSETDLSGLFTQKKEASLKEAQEKFAAFEKSLNEDTLTLEQRKLFHELKVATLGTVLSEKTLKRVRSNGPIWRKLMLPYLEEEYSLGQHADDMGSDFYEYCGIDSGHEYDYDPDFEVEWEAVKKVEGSQKSVAYFVNISATFSIYKNTQQVGTCDYSFIIFAVESKLKNGKPQIIEGY